MNEYMFMQELVQQIYIYTMIFDIIFYIARIHDPMFFMFRWENIDALWRTLGEHV